MQLAEQSPSTAQKMTDLPTLDQAHFDELTQTVRGEVYRRSDHQYVYCERLLCSYQSCSIPPSPFRFQEHTLLFNGNVLNVSKAVVLPLDAQDVSQYAALLPHNIILADIFSGQLFSVLGTDFHRLSKPAAMARVAGQLMATLSLTYPRYRRLISNRHSKEAAGILACAIPLCPSIRAKLALANPFLTRQVLPHRSACLRVMRNKTYSAPTYQPHGYTAPHPLQSQTS